MQISDLVNVHSESRCKGRRCVIHNPTDHHMLGWPINLRETNLIERLCEHGVGHPDPDSVYFFDMIGQGGLGVHGCDGCCRIDESEDDEMINEPEPTHIFESGQIWQDYGEKRIIILQTEGDEITYCGHDGHDIMVAPSFRVLPSSEWGLIFPNQILPGTVWKHIESHNTDLVFVLTSPDSIGRLDVAIANETTVYEWHRDTILRDYRRVELNG